MTKQELISFINTLTPNEENRVIFILNEHLDTGQTNTRTVVSPKDHIITLLTDYFNDGLYGCFKDNVMTTIISYEAVPE